MQHFAAACSILLLAVVAVSSQEVVVVDGEVAACAPVKEQAKQAVLDALGKGKGEAIAKSRELCKAKSKDDCDESKACKYCDGDTTCWPMVDLDNPCDQGTINNILLAGEVAGDVGSAIGETTSAVLSKCNEKQSEADCPTLMCEWCGPSSTCHVYGSPQNQCLRDRMKELAKEQSEAAAEAAKDAASQEIKDIMASCGEKNGNETECAEMKWCLWCGSTHNICYFTGDKTNKCIRERVQKTIDAATGVAKPISEWAGGAYTDLEARAVALCVDKYSDESGCDGDSKCTWCADTSICHVHGSPRNMCGTMQKGVTAVKEKFQDVFGKLSDCDAESIATRQSLSQTTQEAEDNLKAACTEYMKTKFFAQQSLASLGEDMTGVADGVKEDMSEMTAVQFDQAKSALKDAMKASNETISVTETLAAFDEANPCAKEVSGARAASFAMFFVASLLFVCLR